MNEAKKIVLTEKVKQKMIEFFWKTSIPRMMAEQQKKMVEGHYGKNDEN